MITCPKCGCCYEFDRSERNAGVCKMFSDGKTQIEIAELYKITRQRVQQILKKNGMKWDDGGVFVKSTPSKIMAAYERRERIERNKISRFGCAFEQYQFLRSFNVDYVQTPIREWAAQRRSAKSRKIEWKLTLWEWWTLWERSGKYELRGRNKGQYVMARKEDLGPYLRDNVDIIEASENHRNYYAIYIEEHQQLTADGRTLRKVNRNINEAP